MQKKNLHIEELNPNFSNHLKTSIPKLEHKLPQKLDCCKHKRISYANYTDRNASSTQSKAGSQYHDYAQLVEHILKNIVALDHVIFSLRIKVNLQTCTKYSGYNQLNNQTPRVRTQIQTNQVRIWYEKEGSSIGIKPYASVPLQDEPYPSAGTAPPPTQHAAKG